MNIEKIAKKIMANDDSPRVYVGTYAKYNNGDLTGQWVDLDQFSDYDDFIEYCKEEIHGDQEDPELMFQDYEGFPEQYYGESSLDPELWDYIDKINEYDKEDIDAILDYGHNIDQIEDFIIVEGYDDSDLGTYVVNDIDGGVGNLDQNTLENYFDYDGYGRDIRINSQSCFNKNGKFYVKF